MIVLIILILGIFGLRIIINFTKDKFINSSAKAIIKIVTAYIVGLYVLFSLDHLNVSSYISAFNVNYSNWLGYIISAWSVLCFNFGLAIYLPEFIRLSTKNKELVENKNYHVICSITDFKKIKFNYYFNLDVSLIDKRKKFKILEVYINKKELKDVIPNKKINNTSLSLKTSLFNRSPEISLVVENNHQKYHIAIITKFKNKKLEIVEYLYDFSYNT